MLVMLVAKQSCTLISHLHKWSIKLLNLSQPLRQKVSSSYSHSLPYLATLPYIYSQSPLPENHPLIWVY